MEPQHALTPRRAARCLALAIAGAALVAATPAFADCVDFSQARADRAGAALARNAPTAAQLGLPSLEGLTLNAPKTTGDPRCDGPGPPKRFFYTTNRTFSQLVAWLYPNIRRRTDTDGMNRVWFRNPRLAERMFLTSGTELMVQTQQGGTIWQITVTPAAAVQPLTQEQQPYSVEDIIEGTPWPGGASGKREFVRADGGGTVAPAPSVAAQPQPAAPSPAALPPVATSPAPSTSQASPNCPPAAAGGAAADIGQAIGGALGRNLGGTFGGLLGGSAPRPAPAGDCR